MNASDAAHSIWYWCRVWMGAWTALILIISIPKFFIQGLSKIGENLLGTAVFLDRVFLIFLAWWGARVVVGRIDATGFIYWALVSILMMLIIAALLKLLGNVSSEDLSPVRLVKEFACLCLGIVLVAMIGNGSIPVRIGAPDHTTNGAASPK